MDGETTTMRTQGPPDDWDADEFARSLGGSLPAAVPSPQQDVAAGLATARDTMVGDPPTITLPSDGMATLSRGLLFEDEWHRDALMRETTGADEEALARFDLSKIGAVFLYWDMLLARTVVSIGNINFEEMKINERQSKMRQLLLGDRESLYLALVRATWGPIRTIEQVSCPHCGEMSDQNLVLEDTPQHKSDFPEKTLDEPDKIWYEVELRKGSKLTLRLPTGEDLVQLQAHWKTEPSAAERNTVMLSRLVSRHDDQPINDPVGYAKNLSTPDRQAVTAFIVDMQPGPRLGGVTTACFHCEQEFTLQLGLPRLLQLGV